MTRAKFMSELERLLADIPESERTEALQYYNDYFDDAGAENELRVLVELGSPYEVAQSIKAGLNIEVEKSNNYNIYKTTSLANSVIIVKYKKNENK